MTCVCLGVISSRYCSSFLHGIKILFHNKACNHSYMIYMYGKIPLCIFIAAIISDFHFVYSISTEFLTLMKKVAKSPKIIDVLNIQGVQRQLERLADLLGKIQKALGEYLEQERSSFPR